MYRSARRRGQPVKLGSTLVDVQLDRQAVAISRRAFDGRQEVLLTQTGHVFQTRLGKVRPRPADGALQTAVVAVVATLGGFGVKHLIAEQADYRAVFQLDRAVCAKRQRVCAERDFVAGSDRAALRFGNRAVLTDDGNRLTPQQDGQCIDRVPHVGALLIVRALEQAVTADEAARVLGRLADNGFPRALARRKQAQSHGELVAAACRLKIRLAPVAVVVQVLFGVHAPCVLGHEQQRLREGVTCLGVAGRHLLLPFAAERQQAFERADLFRVSRAAVNPGVADFVRDDRQAVGLRLRAPPRTHRASSRRFRRSGRLSASPR